MRALLLLLGIALLAGGVVAARQASASSYEAPRHTLRMQREGWELRDYAPTIEARVTVRGDFESATRGAFRLLAGYIFGGNQREQSISMTVPVAAQPTDLEAGAPRITGSEGADSWTVAFTMPSEFTLDSLPTPRDNRVSLVAVPGRAWAARSFSGWMKPERTDAEIAALQAALTQAGLRADGPPVIAQYNPPWVPGPLRHNEILIPIAD